MKTVKRLMACIMSALLLLTAIPAMPAYAADSSAAYVTTGDVNMRSGAGTSYNIVVTVPAKTSVTVTDTSNSGWYKASYKNKQGKQYKGYISSKYLKKDKAAKKDAATGTYTATGNVYMRKKADKQSDAVIVIPEKASVTVTDTSNSKWYKATYKKKGEKYTGYVSSKYLKKAADPAVTYTATGNVNMRAKAGMKYDVVVVVPVNATVSVTDTSNSKWYKATYKDKKGKKYTGYISSKYLKKGDNSKKKAEKTDSTYKTTGNVNMRTEASTKSDIVVVVPANASVTVKDTSNKSWYKAKYKDKKGKKYTGYISSKYLAKK